MGATRLKVMDLHHGNQPMKSAGLVLVYNGEVYNYKEIRSELVALGHHFGSSGDTEVVLRAYAQWGSASFARLRGMFAIAIWSEADRQLVLARDRAGIKPLYFLEEGQNLYFGSELKAIFSHSEVKRSIDLQALDAYLGMNYVPGRRTMAEGVCKLQPGHFLLWQDGLTSIQPYVDPFESPKPSRATLPQAAEELDHLLHAAVREQLVADVPVGLWLSGGLDSSTLVHYASQHATRRLKTFSITFRGRSFDESSHAHEVASAYGTDHHEFDLGPDQVTPESIIDLAYHSDEPNADAGAVPVWHLSRITADEATVALSGGGSDELFGGYLTYQADRYAHLARKTPAAARRLALQLAFQLRASDEKIGLEYKVQRFLEGSLLPPAEAHIFWNGTLSAKQRSDLLYSGGGSYIDHVLATIPARGKLDRFLKFDQTYYLTDNLLTKVDRMSMAHSLEVRPAFLDPRIVDFARRQPMGHLIRGGTSKRVLRHLMNGKLPATILEKKKQGLDIPVHEWLRGHLRPLLMDTVNQRSVEDSGLLRWDRVAAMIDTHMKREANLGYHLWGILMLFLWIKQCHVTCQEDSQAYRAESVVTA